MSKDPTATKGTILITDDLFIFDDHERMIKNANYGLERLKDPHKKTEAQLCDAVKGKVGYILGGTEQVTANVIKAADKLKVISFTGTGYAEFIPGHSEAKRKGIAITAARGGNADSVAEFALTMCLSATRRVFALTHENGPTFVTTKSASETVLGIVGFGDVGRRVADLATKMGFSVLINSRSRPKIVPAEMRFVSLDELVKNSDIISLHVDKLNGERVLKSQHFANMREGTSIVNCAFQHALEFEALLPHVRNRKFSYLADHVVEDAGSYPAGSLIGTNGQSAFNTHAALRKVSNQTTRSLLAVLETGDDEYRVV